MGRFVLAGSSWIQRTVSIIEGEALALYEAMKQVEQRGLSNVIFETDAKCVADAIHGVYTGVSEFNIIINKIRCMLSLRFDFEVKSIRRQANTITPAFDQLLMFYRVYLIILKGWRGFALCFSSFYPFYTF
ncbi:cytochrome p450 [Trifolium pratense]|uniref:Cytochrome p450 n=1 Tax=Trifolium pratense TaxID=57577 RepID=A0A2K3K3C9_TRIPR|nr:cytochrome p450 [Trifolium pratense]